MPHTCMTMGREYRKLLKIYPLQANALPPFLISNFMHRYLSGQDFSELLDSSTVDCVRKHVPTPTDKVSIVVGSYAESSPVTTDSASCFNASRLSINTITADFPNTHSAKLPFFVTVVVIVDLTHNITRNGGRGICMRLYCL